MSETIHYHQFNTITGKANLVIKEMPDGTIANWNRNYIPKRSPRSKKQIIKRKLSFVATLSRMYNKLMNK